MTDACLAGSPDRKRIKSSLDGRVWSRRECAGLQTQSPTETGAAWVSCEHDDFASRRSVAGGGFGPDWVAGACAIGLYSYQTASAGSHGGDRER
ncbi:hypothetical protein LBMAG48_11090 [Phycisphaerae bacterium]|nr:hypothetical protein LBMAG48_11090 [Phycisphaerae bacterium]